MFMCKDDMAAIFIVAFFYEYGMLYLSRFSTVAVQMHGKHQRTVQFCQSAPVGNLSELL